MPEITYAEAIVAALSDIMSGDDRVNLIGSFFLGLSPKRVLLDQLRQRFPSRVFDPPIAELGFAGTAVGAAMTGLRPIVDLTTASFIFQAFPQIANEAANAYYMSGGQTSVPVVFHVLAGIRGGGAEQHSHSPQAMLWNTPGLEIMLPSSPYDVKGLLKTAIASENPTVFVNHARLFEEKGEVPDGDYAVPFGKANIRRQGRDVTVIATSLMVPRALEAAEALAAEGIDVEVVDPRTLVPLDLPAILDSVGKTGRVVIADECHRSCGVAAELAALIADEAFDALRAPVKRVTFPDVPVPFSPVLERALEPTTEKVAAAVRLIAR